MQVEARLYEEIRHLREKDVELEQMIAQLQDKHEDTVKSEADFKLVVEERVKMSEENVVLLKQRITQLEEDVTQLIDNDTSQVQRKHKYFHNFNTLSSVVHSNPIPSFL